MTAYPPLIFKTGRINERAAGDSVLLTSAEITDALSNDAITYAKIQNVSATDKVLGRSTAGAGDIEEIAFTSAARALADDATAAAMLVTLGAAAVVQRGRLVVAGATAHTFPGVSIVSQTVVAIAANVVRYFPILVEADATLDQLTIAVTVAGAGSTTARLGVYNANTGWEPGSLVLDAGTVAVDSTGNKSISVSQALAPGRYYLALNSSGTPTLRFIRGSLAQPLILSTISGSALITQISGVQTYAAFPSTGTATDTVVSATAPFEYGVFCRFSAA